MGGCWAGNANCLSSDNGAGGSMESPLTATGLQGLIGKEWNLVRNEPDIMANGWVMKILVCFVKYLFLLQAKDLRYTI